MCTKHLRHPLNSNKMSEEKSSSYFNSAPSIPMWVSLPCTGFPPRSVTFSSLQGPLTPCVFTASSKRLSAVFLHHAYLSHCFSKPYLGLHTGKLDKLSGGQVTLICTSVSAVPEHQVSCISRVSRELQASQTALCFSFVIVN